jgi:uncharacterized protein (DUF433 family)
MIELPASPFVERRGQGYYMAGSRISLDSIAYAVFRGETLEEILADFPAIRSPEKVEGVMAFVNAHAEEVKAYLAVEAQRWEEAAKTNRPDLVEQLRKFADERDDKSA